MIVALEARRPAEPHFIERPLGTRELSTSMLLQQDVYNNGLPILR
jgi:hypothetical protein